MFAEVGNIQGSTLLSKEDRIIYWMLVFTSMTERTVLWLLPA